MSTDKYKQMRISKLQYDAMGEIAKTLGISRSEVLNNVVGLANMIVQHGAKSIKIVDLNGEEKEIWLALLTHL